MDLAPPNNALGDDCADADNSFGPAVVTWCRVFDFTLLFENVVFSLLPAAALLLASLFRFQQIRHAREVASASALLPFSKLAAAIAFASTQLASLILWSTSDYQTDASVGSAAVGFLASLVIIPLSYVESRRCPRPSIVLNVYLFGSSLLDAVQLRTLWLAGLQSLAIAGSVGLGTKLVLLVLEALPKNAPSTAEPEATISREERAGIYSLRTFWWLNEILWLGRRQGLKLENLYSIDPGLKTARYSSQLAESWRTVDHTGKYSLLHAVFFTLKWPLLAPAIPRVVLIGFNFAQPLLLKRALRYIEQSDGRSDDNIGYGLIGATALVYGGLALFNGYYGYLLYRSIILIRGALIDIIYRKSLDIELSAAQKAAPVGLVTAEVERIDITIEKWHSIWASVIELAIGIFLLEIEVGWACIAPAIAAFVSTFAVSWVSKLLPPKQKAWNQAIQKRVALTSTMLSNMKSVKMMGFSHSIEATLQASRMTELAASAGFRRFMAMINTIVLIPKQLSTPFTLTLFVLAVQPGGNLTASRAFTTLSLVEMITTPLALLLQTLQSITTSLACLDRIQDYLKSPDRTDPRTADGKQKGSSLSMEKVAKDDILDESLSLKNAISFKDASISYNSADSNSFALSSVSMNVSHGNIAMITGPIGSGKSLLLKAVLGEVEVRGELCVRPGKIAYCNQTPWLPNGSVRDCLLGMSGTDSEPSWFDEVVHACALGEDQDLHDLLRDSGAKAVGSSGMALSEGQKARIALARAVYSRAPLLVLDDIFRSLDLRTEMLISERLLSPANGLLKRYAMTALLATHSARHLPHADQLFVLEGGTLTEVNDFRKSGTSEANDRGHLAGQVEPPSKSESTVSAPEPTEKHPVTAVPDSVARDGTPKAKPVNKFQPPKAVVVGSRDKSTYSFYFRPIGFVRIGVLLSTVVSLAVLTRFQRIWVDWWTAAGPSQNSLYIGVYYLLAGGACLSFTFYFWWMFMFVVPVTAGGLHEQLLRSVLGAPLSYFTAVDSGVILNRFSQDMAIINGMLPVSFFTAVSVAMMVLAQIAFIAYGSKYMAITIPITLAALWLLSRFYLLTSQQLRILDIELKAPVYTSLTETKDGLATIRAFGWQSSYQRNCASRIDDSKRAIYMMFMIQRWLNFVLDLIITGLATCLMTLGTQLRTSTDAAALGVGLSSVIGFSTLTSQFIVAYTDLENQLGAVARIKDCVDNIESEDASSGSQQPPQEWPSNGEVNFSHVSVNYENNHSQPALNDVSFRVRPGQKVLICGRTGSGKSTLLSALLRMVDTPPSSTISIDGVEIGTVGAEIVRQCFAVIPQAPFFLPGSVRLNLTASWAGGAPPQQDNDDAMIAALTKVGLWDEVLAPRGGLDAELAAATLSHGYQQLFCLAVAMLRKRRGSIVVMDEATSGVDEDTERRMYRLIEEEFRECTVINVAHSLRLASEVFDMAVVLSGGVCVEVGGPKELLEAKGEFWRLMDG